MKIRIDIASQGFSDEHCLYVDGELGQVLADLKSGKIDITDYIHTSDSWLCKNENIILLPNSFIVSLVNDGENDATITVYDFYVE